MINTPEVMDYENLQRYDEKIKQYINSTIANEMIPLRDRLLAIVEGEGSGDSGETGT